MQQCCLVLHTGLVVTHPEANTLGHAGLMALLNEHGLGLSDLSSSGFLNEQHQVVDQLYHLANSAEVERYVDDIEAG